MKLPDFKNEPLSDFKNNPAHRRRMEYALEEIREELGREYDLVIGGERIKTKEKLVLQQSQPSGQSRGRVFPGGRRARGLGGAKG